MGFLYKPYFFRNNSIKNTPISKKKENNLNNPESFDILGKELAVGFAVASPFTSFSGDTVPS